MRTTEAATAASVLARKAKAAKKRLPPLTAEERNAVLDWLRDNEHVTAMLLDLEKHTPSKAFAYVIEAMGFAPIDVRSELLGLLGQHSKSHSARALLVYRER